MTDSPSASDHSTHRPIDERLSEKRYPRASRDRDYEKRGLWSPPLVRLRLPSLIYCLSLGSIRVWSPAAEVMFEIRRGRTLSENWRSLTLVRRRAGRGLTLSKSWGGLGEILDTCRPQLCLFTGKVSLVNLGRKVTGR